MIEIERKFLVITDEYKIDATNKHTIKQGFLNTDKNRVVRIRLTRNKGFITVKGKSSEDGLERYEWEKELDLEDAENLLKLCKQPIIEKTRYEIPVGVHIFEVDEFSGENSGLTIAEIELKNKTEKFQKPLWLGKEVTGNIKYYNSNLITYPYKNWKP